MLSPLGKTQSELDFVDISLQRDNRLFVDPFAISQKVDRWSQSAASTIRIFFQQVVDDIRGNRHEHARELLMNLREPNETRLGFSRGRSQGAGIGELQADQIFEALRESGAVREGIITALEETELMIEGISHDKISDLTTNIIRGHLVEYTADQCQLYGITTERVAIPPIFNTESMEWEAQFVNLPVWHNRPIVLVPKSVVRYSPAYRHGEYYQSFVLNFLQIQELHNVRSGLVRIITNQKLGTQRSVVYKKDLAERYPKSKQFLYEFSRDHPEVLREYREELKHLEQDAGSDVDTEDEQVIAEALMAVLRQTPTGSEQATAYHNLMIGVVEFLFYPSLLHPRKEQEIHQGRKRIDIAMENSARSGVFFDLPNVRRMPCAYVPIECKNYGGEVGNPELDQLAGRFAVNRGKAGFLCCRDFADRALFVQRCRDTLRDDRGLVIPLNDATILELLEAISRGDRPALDRRLRELVAEIWLD